MMAVAEVEGPGDELESQFNPPASLLGGGAAPVDGELRSQFNPPAAELDSQFNPGAISIRPRRTPQGGGPVEPADTPDTIRLIADEVGHDENLGIFVARGNVEILREDKIVKADVVTYNERTKRITASGNVQLLEPDGDTQFASYADVTDDVKEGILYDFRMLMKDNARLAANRAYRVDQDTKEILRKGVYKIGRAHV